MSEESPAGHQPPATTGSEPSDRTVSVDVELTAPMLELVRRLKRDDETVEEYVASTVSRRVRLAATDHLTFDAGVDVPDEAVEIGRLRAEDARLRGREDVDERDFILEHTNLRFAYPDPDEGEQ